MSMIWLMYCLREMGLTGICFLFYKKPMTSLNNGLVQLKTQQDVDDILEWTKGVREIGIYVTHTSRKLAKSLMLGEMYADFRHKWPKDTLKETSDEEAKLLGYRGDGGSKKDVWYLMQGPDDVIPYASEVVADDVERPEVQGPQVEGVDEFMELNNVVYDRSENVDNEDYDFETEIFMREDDYNYSNEEEIEDSDIEDEASIGNERETCYIDGDETLEDMGPLLNEDVGPLPEDVFEHSD
ncbi:hypothetical protein LIER_03399 [Lithospermum erythrorhizon]|uniref:Uncharacterized protein n=1 Tax=Lithospermum erythrorhizon TaxID=34254 RepID=A0AAV3NTR2_LITER